MHFRRTLVPGSVLALIASLALAQDSATLGARLDAAATRASLHQGVATGARGAPIAELTVEQAEAGTLGGTVDLTRAQREALLAGHLYIQLHAARGVAPDNAVLWGFLLMSQSTSPCAAP
jgi:hypothetical protein